MTSRRLGLIAVLAVSVITPVLVAPISDGRVAGLVAHEWGTFTSVAGEDGRAVQWLPLEGPTDLPNFVNRIDCRLKGSLPGMVRMETPVIYFYAPREMTVNVNVRFRQGIITEWFPRPAGLSLDSTSGDAFRGEIAWTRVKVEPGGRDDFRVEREPNHYYVARETDAAPLSVGPERERFLFYRGVGRLPPHIAASVNADGQVVVSETRGAPLGDIILFENRDGAMAYQSLQTSSTSVTLNPLTVRGERPVTAEISRAGSRRTRPLSQGSEGHGGELARLVVRARHAALLHRLERGGRYDAAAADRASSRGSEARVRGATRDCHAQDAERSQKRVGEKRSTSADPVRTLSGSACEAIDGQSSPGAAFSLRRADEGCFLAVDATGLLRRDIQLRKRSGAFLPHAPQFPCDVDAGRGRRRCVGLDRRVSGHVIASSVAMTAFVRNRLRAP